MMGKEEVLISTKGRKHISHFHWLLALVDKKCFPNNYKKSCSLFSNKNFQIASLPRGSKTQLYVPIFQPYLYNNRHKFNFIHALKNFTTTTKVYFTRKTVKFKTSPIDSKRGELELHMTKKKRKKQCCELRFPQSRTHTQHYLFGFLFVICESNPRSLESIDLVLKSIVAIRKILQCMNEVEFMLTTI